MDEVRRRIKPWGTVTVLFEHIGYKVVLLEISAAQRLSLQRHTHRLEYWVVVSGIALVTVNDTITKLGVGEYIDVHKKDIHRIENPSKHEVLQIIEVQIGDFLSDEDIERIEDDYGRIKST